MVKILECGIWAWKGNLKTPTVFEVAIGEHQNIPYVIIADLPDECRIGGKSSIGGGLAENIISSLYEDMKDKLGNKALTDIKWFSWTRSSIDEVKIRLKNGELYIDDFSSVTSRDKEIIEEILDKCNCPFVKDIRKYHKF
ncbi:hypothetical protein [Thermococcus aciditolerans]|uniref:Uncharacterized protein n=1 Tax=Thermococcus aciditolerans TaxID=2598455 RepID=A0A5C0SNH0_9EURY|nr:hypothetical protein [Thermococcus aciditolerans]QEK14718.1 hypothetical protein FPV09_05995 [Thermococcus aciditolerans]